jgi:hypothetical protein
MVLFTNSLPIIYLQMWLNEKPDLTQFASQQIPQDVQLDVTNAVASKKQRATDTIYVGKSHKKSPNEAVAEAMVGFLKVKRQKTGALNSNLTASLGVELQMFMHVQSALKKMSCWRSRYQ